MSARDDYPLIAYWSATYGDNHSLIGQVRDALAEIDQLRESNTHQARILRDVLPIMRIPLTGAMLFVDHTWVLVLADPEGST
jgi:hypothetical protein